MNNNGANRPLAQTAKMFYVHQESSVRGHKTTVHPRAAPCSFVQPRAMLWGLNEAATLQTYGHLHHPHEYYFNLLISSVLNHRITIGALPHHRYVHGIGPSLILLYERKMKNVAKKPYQTLDK